MCYVSQMFLFYDKSKSVKEKTQVISFEKYSPLLSLQVLLYPWNLFGILLVAFFLTYLFQVCQMSYAGLESEKMPRDSFL